MAKLRRFAIGSLEGLAAGAELHLPHDESRHVHVLRLKPGEAIEVLDPNGQVWQALIVSDSPDGVMVKLVERLAQAGLPGVKLVLGVAWPKGKRAAVMVEKCAELGVDELIPIQFQRGVVSKDDESEGIVRLRRIAAEASKQSRRESIMTVSPESSLRDFLTRFRSVGMTLVMDPRAPSHLINAIQNRPVTASTVALLIGPQGGLTPAEIALSVEFEVGQVRMATNVLRIETAALAAAALSRAVLDGVSVLI